MFWRFLARRVHKVGMERSANCKKKKRVTDGQIWIKHSVLLDFTSHQRAKSKGISENAIMKTYDNKNRQSEINCCLLMTYL